MTIPAKIVSVLDMKNSEVELSLQDFDTLIIKVCRSKIKTNIINPITMNSITKNQAKLLTKKIIKSLT
jgi:hypothetical protein